MIDPAPGVAGERQGPRPHIVYFSFDSANEGIRRRVNEAIRAGYQITMFSFRRPRTDKGAYQIPAGPQFQNIDLGETLGRSYFKRLGRLVRAGAIILENREKLRAADIVVTRNIDMAVLALIARPFARRTKAFIYEILDVQPLMSARSAAGWCMRLVESVVLRYSDLLIVSSPGFVSNYFNVFFKKTPPIIVIENKISFAVGTVRPERAPPPALDDTKPVWTIGWFGKLRCRASLQLLTELARGLPDTVRIYIRGYPDAIPTDEFNEAITTLPNILFEGSYRTPGDLRDMMSRIHFNWCIDLYHLEGNSSWLLPNRIYEGGYFAVPALTLDGTETGAYVRQRELGYTLAAANSETLTRFFSEFTAEQYARMRTALEAAPPDRFVDDGAFPRMLDSILASGRVDT